MKAIVASTLLLCTFVLATGDLQCELVFLSISYVTKGACRFSHRTLVPDQPKMGRHGGPLRQRDEKTNQDRT